MTRPAAPSGQPAARTVPDVQADGRDGRVVGKNDDSPLESLGKAISAPIEGAADEDDEGDDHGRAFVDLTRTFPQGEEATEDPTVRKPGDHQPH